MAKVHVDTICFALNFTELGNQYSCIFLMENPVYKTLLCFCVTDFFYQKQVQL